MRLYQTLHQTIKWKKLLVWYFFTLFAIIFSTEGISIIMLFAIFMLTILSIIITLMVFGKVIYGKNNFQYMPTIWPFRTIFESMIIYDSDSGLIRREWCKSNLDGKWIHSRHGYFAFSRKEEALAFKLMWAE